MDERPIRPAGQAVLRAFAGRHAATGADPGEPLSQLEEFLINEVGGQINTDAGPLRLRGRLRAVGLPVRGRGWPSAGHCGKCPAAPRERRQGGDHAADGAHMQEFEQGLLGVTQEELNEMDEDAVVAMVRAADEQEGEIDEDARTHLSALELESLPSHTLAEPDGGAECSVCLAQMSGGQEVAPLACGHTFHRPCIVRWFARSCRCPYCRTPVPRASESGRGEPRGSRLGTQ